MAWLSSARSSVVSSTLAAAQFSRVRLEFLFIKIENNLSETSVVTQCAMETHELPGMGTTLGANDATHAIHSWAAVTPFLAAIASIAETRARL